MRTLTLEVEDNFLPNLLDYLKQFQSNVKICKDKNLEHDPYFYERQKELQDIRNAIKNNKSELISFED